MKSHLVMYAIPSSSSSLSIWKQATYQLPRIYQVTIDPWFQIYRELEDDGIPQDWSRIKDAPSKVKGDRLAAMAAVRQSPEVCD